MARSTVLVVGTVVSVSRWWTTRIWENYIPVNDQKNYNEFNSKKILRLSERKNKISILQYSMFSQKLLNEYKASKNLQFLNTSLKINDFIIYCQIKSNDKRTNGSISSYFPCCYKNFRIDYFTNELILKNLQKELIFIEEIEW